MTLQAIATFAGSLVDAFGEAKERGEPRFVPARFHADDRGWSLMNQMRGVMRPEGQINYSVQYPGVVKAWHRHAKQTDFWLCLRGQRDSGGVEAGSFPSTGQNRHCLFRTTFLMRQRSLRHELIVRQTQSDNA